MTESEHLPPVLAAQGLAQLRERRSVALKALMRKNWGDKHYRFTLRSFLEASAELDEATRAAGR